MDVRDRVIMAVKELAGERGLHDVIVDEISAGRGHQQEDPLPLLWQQGRGHRGRGRQDQPATGPGQLPVPSRRTGIMRGLAMVWRKYGHLYSSRGIMSTIVEMY